MLTRGIMIPLYKRIKNMINGTFKISYRLICAAALMMHMMSISAQSSVVYSTDFTPTDTMGWGADSDLSSANMPADAEMGWALATSTTPTANTGPDIPHQGTHYAYFEHSCGLVSPVGGCPETMYSFVSPEIVVNGTSARLSFYYLLQGDNMSGTPSSLQINVLNGGSSTQIFSQNNGMHPDGSLASWTEADLDLSAYDNQTIRLEFVGIEGTITNSEGDIGIDTLTVTAIPNVDTAIPTLGEWGLIILLISMLSISIVGIKQHQVSLAHVTHQ